MAYIGLKPLNEGLTRNIAGQRFSGNDSDTDFTLNRTPANEFSIEVFVNNVRQDPNSAYTVTDSTLSFAAAPSTGTNNIYVVFQGEAIEQPVPVAGSITAGSFVNRTIGSASQKVTGIFAESITVDSLTANVVGNLTGDVTGNLTGTIQTAAQPNITSVGTLTSLAVDGDITLDDVVANTLTGTVQTAAQPNITSVGTLGSLNVTNAINAANVITSGTMTAAAFKGDGSQLTNAGSTVATQTSGPDLLVAFTGITSGTMTSANVSSFLTFNPSTGTLTANSFSGDGSGLTGAGASVANDAVTSTDLFVPFTAISSGSLTSANVATGVLTFRPSTGELKSTIVTSTSDATLKKDVETIENGLAQVEQLRGVTYKWINNETDGMGLIAQELEEIVPQAVSTDSEGMKSINYSALVGLLVEAIKELKQQIDEK